MIPGSQGTDKGGQIEGAQGTLDDDASVEASQGKGGNDAILAEALKRYKSSVEFDGENRLAALNDLWFIAGWQWPEDAKRKRQQEGRPALTINTLPTYLHQVTNDQRQNSPSIKVHPVDDDADIETAQIIQGLIRHIEYDSNADVAYDTAVNSAATIGFGFFRLVTEYCDETSFDQDIKIKRIRNALSVRIDPLSQEPDGSDMKWCFVECLMPREEFKAAFPNANANNSTLLGQDTYHGMLSDSAVLVTEYYCIETTPAEIVMLADGTTTYADEAPKGVAVLKRRPGTRSRTMWRKITAVDVLEEAEIPCKWIPVFPVYGDEVDIEGKVFRAGIVRHAKDPAQMYNYWMTTATEEVALRPKTPHIMAEGQEEGHEQEWARANSDSFPYLLYKPTTIDGTLVPPPQRQQMADVPAGMLAMAAHARDNIKATTGLFDSSLGARGNATSGRQELAQQQQGDVANFHYSDNLTITIRHLGRCIINMAPKVYDTPRVVRILGEGDEPSTAQINQPATDDYGNPMLDEAGEVQAVLHNLTVGTYDVTVASGPSYSTMRQESAQFFANAMSAAKDPATAAVVGYLAIKNQDVPGAETAAKMMATLLPEPAKKVMEHEAGGDDEPDAPQPIMTQTGGPVPAEQAGQLIDQLSMALQQAKEALEKAGAAKQQAEATKAEAERMKAERELVEAQKAAEIAPMTEGIALAKAEADKLKAQADAMSAEADLLRAQSEVQSMPRRLQIEEAQIAFKSKAAPAGPAPEGGQEDYGVRPATVEDVAALLDASKSRMPSSMVIRTPTGAVYEIGMDPNEPQQGA